MYSFVTLLPSLSESVLKGKVVQAAINGHVLLTSEESRTADSLTIEGGVPSFALMRTAGESVADIIEEYLGTPLEAGGEILFLCGPGNNGGDGFVAASILDQAGYPVRVMLSCEPSELKGDAAEAADLWQGAIDPVDPTALSGVAAVVDSLFGTGLNKALDGDIASLVEAVNELDVVRFAVDIPSGLNANTGQPVDGGVCFQADVTITFFKRKIAHQIAPGRFISGGTEHIHVADIGISDAVLDAIQPEFYANAPSLWGHLFPYPGPQTHKYQRGHLLVLGGREPTLGACRLASMAGLRVGAGLVTLAAPTETYPIQASALTDIMVRKFDSSFGFLGIMADARIGTILIGPGAGVGEKTAELVQDVAAKNRSIILDADALTSLIGRLEILTGAPGSSFILTPHEGEFVRLFPSIPPDIDRVNAVRQAAKLANSTIVLKGVSTTVAAPDGRVSIAANAPSWLSCGGTGDVLAGLIAGLVAQGMPDFEAASAAVWIHGECAMSAGRGLIASDLINEIPAALP